MPKVRAKDIDKDMYVQVKNNTFGTLVYVNQRTQQKWVLKGYGAIDEMPVSELITMKSTQPKFLTEGWLVILDKDVADYLGLTELYKDLIAPDNVEQVFQLKPEEIKEKLESNPRDVKETVAKIAKEKIKKGELDSIGVVKIVEESIGKKITEE